jgi:hypothetical protein
MAGGGAGCGAEEAREVGGEPDMRGRPGSERGEEEGKREGADERAPGGSDCKKKKRGRGRRGRWAGGGRLDGPVGREGEERRWAAGWGLGLDRFCCFFSFSFFFKSFSNLFQTLFKFKPLNKFSQTFLNYF